MRKLVVILLAFALVFMLAACSGSTPAPAASDEAAPAPAATTETPDKPVSQGEAVGDLGDTDMSVLGGLKIAFSQTGNSAPWRVMETESMQAAADKYGATYMMTDAQEDNAKQLEAVRSIIAWGPDYVIYNPREQEASSEGLRLLVDAGIPVVVPDRSCNWEEGDIITFICNDFYDEAWLTAEFLLNNMGDYGFDKANIVEITGTPGSSAAIERSQGFVEFVAQNSGAMEIVESQTGDFVRETAMTTMENIIAAKKGEFNAVFAHNADMAVGAVNVLKAAGEGLVPGKDVLVMGIDELQTSIEMIVTGEVLAITTCSPLYGEDCFKAIAMYINGDPIPNPWVRVDEVIHKGNAQEYLDQNKVIPG